MSKLLTQFVVKVHLEAFTLVDADSWTGTARANVDQLGENYNLTQVVVGDRMTDQNGRTFEIDIINSASSLIIDFQVTELQSESIHPIGEALIYKNVDGILPISPRNTIGISPAFQARVINNNSVVISSLVTGASNSAPVTENISQLNHGFSVGDPVRKSGDYLLAQDTGPDVVVIGIVIAVIDVNNFTIQYEGKFDLVGHGLPIGEQLYVQSDGTYSILDTGNHIVYGFAVSVNKIQIGLAVGVTSSKSHANSYDNSNSALSQETKNLAIDELAKMRSHANIADFKANLTAPLDTRIKIRDSGVEYIIQASAPQFSTVDGEYVIDMSNRYAVADLKGLRDFKSYSEFKKLAPLCGFTGKTETIKVGRLEIKVSATPLFMSTSDYTLDAVVDGFFIDSFQVAFAGENILKSNQYFIPAGSGFGWNFDPTYELNYKVSGQFDKTGVLLTGITGNGSRDIIAYLVAAEIQIGQTYTYSFDMIVEQAAGAPYVRFDDDTTVLLNTDGELHRYSLEIPVDNSFVIISIRGTSATDRFIFLSPQIEIGTTETDLKATGMGLAAKSGTMYANIGSAILENGVLDLSKLGRPVFDDLRLRGDDTAFLEAAYAYCAEGQRANVIRLAKGIYFIKKIVVPNNVLLEGAVTLLNGRDTQDFGVRGTVIHVTPDLPTDNCFEFSPRPGYSIYFGGGLRNIEFFINGDINNVIDITESQGCIYENIIIRTDTASIATCISFKTQTSSDQYRNFLGPIQIKSDVSSLTGTGIQYQGSTANNMRQWDIIGCQIGVDVQGGNQCFIDNYCLVQQCDIGLKVSGGDVVIVGLYTEDSGKNSEPTIKMTGGSLTLMNPTLQSDGTANKLWEITGGEMFTVYGGQIRTFGSTLTTGIKKVNFFNLQSTEPLRRLPVSSDMWERISVVNNFDWITKIQFENWVPGINYANSQAENFYLRNSSLTEKITLEEITLEGKKQNLLGDSNVFLAGTFGGPDVITVTANASVAPDGTTTADRVTYSGSDIGGGSVGWFGFPMLDVFSIGDDFVFFFYVKLNQEMNAAKPMFEVRPYSDESNEVEISFYAAVGEWTLIHITGEIVDNTGANTMAIRFLGALANGESLDLWGAALQKGKLYGTQVSTVGSGVDTQEINISTQNDEPINILSKILAPNLQKNTFSVYFADPTATIVVTAGAVYSFNLGSNGWTQTFNPSGLKTGESFFIEWIDADVNNLTIASTSGGFIRPYSNRDFAPDATELITSAEGRSELIWTGTDLKMFE